MGTDVQNWSK